MAAITTAEISGVIFKQVAAQALQRLKANTVAVSLVNRNYEAVFAQQGDTITIGIPSNFQVLDLADGNTVTKQNPTTQKTQLVLNEHKHVSFQVTDLVELFTPINIKTTNMSQALANMAETIDTSVISAAYAGFTFNAPVGAYNTALTEATVLQARLALTRAKTPKTAEKMMIVESGAYNNLLATGRLTEYQTRGRAPAPGGSNAFGADVDGGDGSAIAFGGIGMCQGFKVFEDQVTPITLDGSGNPQTHNIAFSPDAIIFAQRMLPQAPPGQGVVQMYADEDNMSLRVSLNYNADILGSQITLDTLYGIGIGRVQFGVEVRS